MYPILGSGNGLLHVQCQTIPITSDGLGCLLLTHWGWVTHICIGNLTIIGSDNGLSPGRRQAITWTSVGILIIGTLGTNFIEMLIEIHTFSFKKIHLKMSSGKWWPFCLGLYVLKMYPILGSGNGLSHVQCQAIPYTSDGLGCLLLMWFNIDYCMAM